MTDFILRLAVKSDVAALFALEKEAFLTDRISLRSWKRMLISGSVRVVVALSNEQVIGSAVILFRRNSFVSRIYSIAVKASVQRAGVGRALLAYSCQMAHQKNQREVRLESRVNNHRAHALFRSLGFLPWGKEREAYYSDGVSAIRFNLKLPTRMPS